ncbi:MAG: C4-type zinc ribbon domain-containing protein, partial [Dehalococcoidia bacterium]
EQENVLKEVVRKLEDEEALERARERVGNQQDHLADLDRQQREADALISDIQAKLTPLEKKVYGGSVKNPRELEALEHEAKILKKRLGEAEDRSLSLMESVEAAQETLDAARNELAAMEEQRLKEVESLSADKGRIEKELSRLGAQRQGVVTTIDAEAITLYESLRSSMPGSAVAKVERGMCQGCRITLPMSAIQKARLGRSVVRCSSCGRILYVS